MPWPKCVVSEALSVLLQDDATPKGKPVAGGARGKESDTASSGGEDRGSREPTPGKRRHQPTSTESEGSDNKRRKTDTESKASSTLLGRRGGPEVRVSPAQV